ncbi:MAG TPA: phosphatase PAP2 family protein, partial [Bryobacteraceae bacterium]|nr:phosphatase PAP2 family protein [Bryobacteraceae bacterium]
SELSIGMTAVAGPRNAIPSMQATWALLVWWSAWRLNWWARIVATLFLVLTLLSALGSGDHYVVDLVVAVPFTLGVEGLCRRRGYAAAGLGFGLTLGWFILLRSGFRLPAPGLGWLLVAGTILTCVVFQIPLYRGQHTEEGQALSSRLSAMTGARLASRTR